MNLKKSCSSCSKWCVSKDESTVQFILNEYHKSSIPWYLGFSGGKDSSALLKLTYQALLLSDQRHKKVTILYCDTGVDIPIVTKLVYKTLRNIRREAKADKIPLVVKIAKPATENTYFVKVIGRGYPPPTNKFRWCTDRLRINPVQSIIKRTKDEAVVLLGTRLGESNTRDKILNRHSLGKSYFRQSGASETTIFSPIVDYSTNDVWSTIMSPGAPSAIDGNSLITLYKEASGECPTVRDPKGAPCGKGRFGCWTCTVVRKDKAMASMVSEGHPDLLPLLEFRNWLIRYRDDPKAREKFRRNGQKGRGPFTLLARKEILRRLRRAERRSSHKLIQQAEIEQIKLLWRADQA